MGVAAILGVVILGAVIAYGLYQYSTRNRRLDPVRDAATKRNYQEDGPPPEARTPR